MHSKIAKTCIIYLISFFILSPVNSSAGINDYFSGDILSQKALRYREQEAVIKNAPTKTNDLPSISSLLSSSAAEIESRLETRAADAIGLAAAAKQSTTSGTGAYADGPQSCCQKSVEAGYNHYFKVEVDLQNTCYRGECDLSGRALSGQPSCSKSVVSGAFTGEVKSNLNDPGAAWQYFGSEAGISTVFPASYAGDSNCPRDNNYDPRLRPWYVQALTSSPLDVVIILDKSGSMQINGRMDSAKKAVKSILSMLRPYDRFAVTPFDSNSISQVWTGASCMDSHNLAFATGKNVGMMKDYVDTIEPSGGTMYSYALDFAKSIFTSSQEVVDDEYDGTRKKVVLFLSDGDPNDGGYDIFTSLRNLVNTVPDIVTMVYGLDIDNQILRDIASHQYSAYGVAHPSSTPVIGGFEKLTPSTIRIKLGRFYAHTAINPNGISEQVQYSLPYVDSFGMGLMVTASKAVIDETDHLQGVVGYDITLKYLLEPLEYLITETTYAWMFTQQQGYMIYHPNMVNPSASVSDLNPVHFSILEPDQGQLNAIKAKLQTGGNFTFSYTGSRFVETPREGGFTSSSKNAAQQQTEGFNTECRTVNPDQTGFDLVVCITKVGDLQSTLDSNGVLSQMNAKDSIYHVPTENQGGVCSHGFRRAYKSSGGVKFAPRQFSIPTQYTTTNETNQEVEMMNKLLNGLADNHANLDPKLLQASRATNILTSGLDTQWKSQDTKLSTDFGSSSNLVVDLLNQDSELVPVWRYFGSIEGTFRVWPSIQLAQGYDPAQRGWFIEALRGNKKTTYISTPYTDAFGMGYLTTVSRSISYDNFGEIAGVIGTDYFISQFGESALQTESESGSIIVNSVGQLIYHSDFGPNSKTPNNFVNVKFRENDGSISGAEPLTLSEIFYQGESLTTRLSNILPILRCHDVSGLRTKKTFDIDRFLGSRDTHSASEFIIKRITGTNAFIITPRNGGTFELLTGSNWKINAYNWPVVDRNNWATDTLKYDQCENKFLGGDDITACQSPGPSLDVSYLGRFDENQGFTGEKVEGLESCFKYMDSWKDYALYRQGGKRSGGAPIALILVIVVFVVCVILKGGDEEEKKEHVDNRAAEVQQVQQPVAEPDFFPQPVVPQAMLFQPIQQQMPASPQPVFNINIGNQNQNENKN